MTVAAGLQLIRVRQRRFGTILWGFAPLVLFAVYLGQQPSASETAFFIGTALFAREREAATIEFLLSRPVSRARILWAKWWPTALCVAVPIFLANWSAVWLSRSIDYDLPLASLTLCCVHGSLFVLAFLAFTTWVSVLCRVQAHVAFWVGGITIVNIGIYLIPRLRRFSLFHASDFDWYAPLLLGNAGLEEMFDPVNHRGLTAWLVVAIVVFYLLALRALRRLVP